MLAGTGHSSLVPLIVHHTLCQGDNKTPTVLYYIFLINLSKLSDWGMPLSLTIAVTEMLSATNANASTISDLILICKLYHFTFVSALLPLSYA